MSSPSAEPRPIETALGKPVRRVEDGRLVQGLGRYVDDLAVPGCLRGHVVRSAHAHARILGIDATEALAMPGVVAVLTAADFAADGLAALPYNAAVPKNGLGVEAFLPPRWPLAAERARFVGDPVAFVVAESAAEARDAAERVVVDMEPLPAVTGLGAATAPDAPAVWDERPDNVSYVHQGGSEAAVDAAFAGAAHRVAARLAIPRVAINSMEPRGHLAVPDPGAGTLHVVAGVQDVYLTRRVLAAVFSRDEGAFEVRTPNVGGSFGMKNPDPELLLTAWAADRLGRPVRWVSDRSEAFLGDHQGRDNLTEAELALDAEGTFLALRVRTLAAVGAYPAGGAGPPVNNLGTLAGVYRTPAIDVRVTGVFTHTNPTTAYRGAGRPEAAYVIERLVDLAAKRLGFDPVALRRRNMIPPDAMPFRTGLTFTYDCGAFEAVMDKALGLADAAGFAARREADHEAGRLRGLGLAAVIERATVVGGFEAVELRFSAKGDVLVLAGGTDQGQGHATTYTQLVCDRLGVPAERVRVHLSDTGRLGAGGGTGGSRFSTMGSAAALRAVDKVVAKAKRIAAHAMEAAEEDVEFAAGRFAVAGTDLALTLAEVAARAHQPARLPPEIEPGLDETGSHRATIENFPNGFHACEVSIDRDTGIVALERYTVVDDVGTVLNPMMVFGQLQGGIVHSVGEALMEEVVHDEGGQPLTGSFMDYRMPRAEDLCFLHVDTHPVPTATNPLGVKGVGEAGTVGALPAVVNAVLDALHPLGVEHLDMPLTPEKVWRAIRDAEARRAL